MENILRIGDQTAKLHNTVNPYAVIIEECQGKSNQFIDACIVFQNCNTTCILCTGLDKIEYLQSHENIDVYHKAYDIIEQYFGTEDDNGSKITPSIQTGPQGTEQFQFAPDQSVPMDGFNF